MIKYALRCADGHAFDSWFQSADAFETLKGRGLVSCAECGSADVSKALMAPKVAPKSNTRPEPTPALPAKTPARTPVAGGPAAEVTKLERAVAELRAKVEANSTWVGTGFAKEVRDQAKGDAPERPIWGEATPKEARALVEEGLPVAPLPFGPKQKAN